MGKEALKGTLRGMEKAARAAIKWAAIIGILLFFLKYTYDNWVEVRGHEWQFNYLLLLLSLTALIGYLFLSAHLWGRILSKMGCRLGHWDTLKVWTYSQMGRYLPGRVWMILGRMHLCKKHNIGKKEIAISTILEIFFLVSGGTIFSLLALAEEAMAFSKYTLLATAPIIAAAIYPRWFEGLIGFLIKIRTKREVKVDFGQANTAKFLLAYTFSWLLMGSAFVLFVGSFLGFPANKFFPLMGVFSLSWIAGFLSFLTPSGLGVREGIMVFLLAKDFTMPVAILISVLSRIWISAGDALSLGVVSIPWRKAVRRMWGRRGMGGA